MKTINCTLSLLLVVLLMTGCQKEVSDPKIETGSKEITNKINGWLSALNYSAGPQWSSRLQLINENLETDKAWLEDLDEGERFIIAPVKDYAASSFNKKRNPVNYLVLIEDKTGNIRKGDFVQYMTDDNRGKLLPRGLIHDYYNHKKIDRDFTLTYLTVFDRPLYEMNYQNGGIVQYSQAERKTNGGLTGRPTENCLEYYWNTYVDGVLVSSVYLGTICCPEVEEGAGGSGGGVEVPEADREKYVSYVAYEENGYNCHPEIHSRVRFMGKKVAGEPQGGHFTYASHYDSWTEDFPYPMDYSNAYWSAWHGSQDAREAFQCDIYYGVGIPLKPINPTKLFLFIDVFP